MKKILINIILTLILIELNLFFPTKIYASNSETLNNPITPNSQLVKLKEKELKSLKNYQEKYHSKTYGLTAYILHKVQIYSIPFVFLGLLISYISKEIVGIRHHEAEDKGNELMITIITIFVICQILPLVFNIVVKTRSE